MKEEFKACFVSVAYKASFELLFHASTVTVRSWKFPGMTVTFMLRCDRKVMDVI
ncbi:MAG: hypothetical protein GY749_33880 [Desulfobacteraceae bacterium]|nr:hypothetical protein [Desulfobacteraceae bacterium]